MYCPKCQSILAQPVQDSPIFDCFHCGWVGHAKDTLKDWLPKKPWLKYVSIDIETTGLDENLCQTLEFGAVHDDWTRPIAQLPRFHRYIYGTHFTGQPYALALNADILKRIAAHNPENPEPSEFCAPEDLALDFYTWLVGLDLDPRHLNAAGKNFASIDRQFLKK